MIRVLGGPKRLCDGLTRRDLLHVGSLSLLGLGASGFDPRAAFAGELGPEPGRNLDLGRFGQAKACILLFLYGSPSQLETFDPKPAAPEQIRGELKSIASSIPGLDVCELLPKMARVMDKVTVIRSVSHPYPLHGVAFATTGVSQITVPMELNPRDPAHWPFIGSVVDHVDSRRREAAGGVAVPRNMVLPWAFSSQRVGEVARAGPYGGFLGQGWDPIFAQFTGKATKTAKKTLADKTWEDLEPYRGITPESRFGLGAVSDLGPDLTLDRLDRRRSLLDQCEEARRALDTSIASRSGIDRHRELAYSLIASEKLRKAFDLDAETPATRDLYGMTLFGQAALTSRRLVEAGGRFLTVFWDEFGLAGTGWDTHWDHFPRMKNELLPGLDQTLSGLLVDLDARGMLDETLVVCMSEHGRTPKLTMDKGGGRDHWSRCYSVLMAGGGIARGRVVGRSDKIASDPVERLVSPKDILATIYHLLGIDPETTLTDRQGRPMTLVPGGAVIPEVIA
jgi:hypothetical protein